MDSDIIIWDGTRLSKNWRELPQPDKKKCNGCGDIKPFNSEYFPVHKKCPWGLDHLCRICFNEKARVRNIEYIKRLKIEVLTAYSESNILGCTCCGETHIEFLTLDHINGGGGLERETMSHAKLYRKLRNEGYPQGEHRTLCLNCNSSIGLYGYCPHQNDK